MVGNWYFITLPDGRSGYAAVSHVRTGLPEPGATIHHVKAGETALGISRHYYGGTAEWGSDHRFYVNGLVYVNAGTGPRGIYKPESDADWDTTRVRENYMIWIPSIRFMKSLRGKVSSGSITYEAWSAVKAAASAVVDFVVGAAAFVAGLLHGALESLWDILVGLKDLIVMVWDIAKSLLTGNLLHDARELWTQLKNLDWGALVEGWIDDFVGKWNDESVAKRWHFRGWVVGYAIMEILLLVFSEGVITGIKWIGKATKVSAAIAKLPKMAEFMKVVRNSERVRRATLAFGRSAKIPESIAGAVKWVERLPLHPRRIWGKSAEEVAAAFRKAGYEVEVVQSTRGSKLSKQIRFTKPRDIARIEVHPGGGRHAGAYYVISRTTQGGKVKVVSWLTYRAMTGEKTLILHMEAVLLSRGTGNALVQGALGEVLEEGVQPAPE